MAVFLQVDYGLPGYSFLLFYVLGLCYNYRFHQFFFKKAIITEIFLLPPFFWDFNYMYIRPLNPQVLPSQFIFPVVFFSSIFFFHLSVCVDVPLILVAFSYVVNCKISDIFEF